MKGWETNLTDLLGRGISVTFLVLSQMLFKVGLSELAALVSVWSELCQCLLKLCCSGPHQAAAPALAALNPGLDPAPAQLASVTRPEPLKPSHQHYTRDSIIELNTSEIWKSGLLRLKHWKRETGHFWWTAEAEQLNWVDILSFLLSNSTGQHRKIHIKNHIDIYNKWRKINSYNKIFKSNFSFHNKNIYFKWQ